MGESTPHLHLSQLPMVLAASETSQVTVRAAIEYRRTGDGPLTMDLYEPAQRPAGALLPAIVLVAGYPDPGYEKMLGRKFKDMAMSSSWARLAASWDLVAITYTNREPAEDLDALLAHLRANAAALGINAARIGLWGLSGNGPLAMSALARGPAGSFRCGVFSCAYLLDLDGETHVADAAKMWGFANPSPGATVADLPPDVPLYIVRAGLEPDPGLNHAIDRFVAAALARSLPITCVNYAGAPHAFEIFHDTAQTREVIRGMLRFARFQLAGVM